MEIVFTIASLALPIAGLFFWGRGVLRSKKRDAILGFSVLALTCVSALAVSETSEVFTGLGILALVFGVETLIVSAFAKPDCPISRRDRIALGIGALVLGALSSLIM